jgi:S1-C subfamily serine protease
MSYYEQSAFGPIPAGAIGPAGAPGAVDPAGPAPRHRHRRSALAAGTALAMVLTVAGAARLQDSNAVSFLSAPGSKSYLMTNSSTVASSVTGAIVDIVSTEKYQNERSAGTGMILSSTGEILTNNHVVNGATSIAVTVVSTGRTYSAKVVGTDPTQDIAVIKLVGASGLKTIPIGDSSTVKVGQQVVARGNAGGTGGAPSVVSGTVTALDQSITAGDEGSSDTEQLTGLIQTNAPIVAGDSGGPLATSSGKVIGIDTAASVANGSQSSFSTGNNSTGDSSTGGSSTTDSEGYAIPIRTALTIAHEIETGKASSTVHIGAHGFLGVELAEQGSTSGNAFGGGFGSRAGGGFGDGGFGSSGSSETVSGAQIAGVLDGGSAARLGLQAGDIITSVNGHTVGSATKLNSLMATTKPGQKVKIGWTDIDGQHHSASVSLGTAAAD